MLHGSERLGAKARWIAQARGTELERYPGEYRELDLAGQGELAAGRILDRARDTVLVVIGIDEQPYAQQHHDKEGDQSTHHDSNEFQGAHRDYPIEHRAAILAQEPAGLRAVAGEPEFGRLL